MNLELTIEERDELLNILENFLGDTRVEVRRTSTPGFRERLVHEEDVLKGLLDKLRALA
jgi:hypothetical protein